MIVVAAIVAGALAFLPERSGVDVHEMRVALLHPGPLDQDVTRAAFLDPGSGNLRVSTLESYHVSPSGDFTRLIEFTPRGERLGEDRINGSTEVRSFAWDPQEDRMVLGLSLDGQVATLSSSGIHGVFRGPTATTFLHALAVDGGSAYTWMSTPLPFVPGYEGLVEIDLATGAHRVHAVPGRGGYGGVESVDPTGRIWYFRAYPLERGWLEPGGPPRVRPAEVVGWDTWDDGLYQVVLTDGVLRKRPVREDMAQRDGPTAPEQFLRSARVDHHAIAGPPLEGLYWDPEERVLLRRVAGADSRLETVGRLDPGEPVYAGSLPTSPEWGFGWRREDGRLVRLLGLHEGAALLWHEEGSTLLRIDLTTGDRSETELDARSVSPAEITSLARGPDGAVYGAGILTQRSIFRFHPADQSIEQLRGAVPGAAGQVNVLLGGERALAGAAYPDSVVFVYDPQAPWAPMKGNPKRAPPLGLDGQMRPLALAWDRNGDLWIASVSDYSERTVHATAKVDPHRGTIEGRTTIEGWPEVHDLVEHEGGLAAIGEIEGSPLLMLIDPGSWSISHRLPLPERATSLVSVDEGRERLYVAAGHAVYEARGHELLPTHEAAEPILRLLDVEGSLAIVTRHTIDLQAGERWTHWRTPPEETLMSGEHWRAAMYSDGRIYVGRGAQLVAVDLEVR